MICYCGIFSQNMIHVLQVVQGVDAAGGLPVPAAHPAAGAAEHAGGGRLLQPAGPTAS